MVETAKAQPIKQQTSLAIANLPQIKNAENTKRELSLGSGRYLNYQKQLSRKSSEDKLQKYAAYAQQLQSYYTQEMPFNLDYDKIKYPSFNDCIFDYRLNHRQLPQTNTQVLDYLKFCRKNEDHNVNHNTNPGNSQHLQNNQGSHTSIGFKQRASSQARSRKSLVPPQQQSNDQKHLGVEGVGSQQRNKKNMNSQVSLKPPSTSHQASRKTFESSQKDFNKHQQSSIHGLKFDSNFECGNLDTVREKEANVYDILIRNDSNGTGHVHWFYFRVKTPQGGGAASKIMQMPTVKFNIQNMTKKESLFEQGMKITILSKKSGQGWTYGGNNITYTKSSFNQDINYLNSKQQAYFSLSFDYKFEYADDEVFFATTIPYTYSNMQRHLLALNQLKELKDNNMFEITSIGKSNGKLDMPLVKIKSPKITPKIGNVALSQELTVNEQEETKPVIFIIGRQHPGETLSSFIIHGLINFLLTPNQAVQQLRDMFDFWIMPIANPDGVVLGNYRCNLQGKDLNRCFQYFNDEEYGGTYSSVQECECIQNYMNDNIFTNQKVVGKKISTNQACANSFIQGNGSSLSGESRIKLFLDIHTHSSQRGIFTYAPCAQIQEQLKIRQFPQILDEISQYFRLASCKYQSEKAKKNCARLAFVRDYKAEYSYTIETSSYAYVEKKTNQTYQLKMPDLLMFGKQIIMALSKLFITEPQISTNISPIYNIVENHQLSGPRFLGYNMPLDFGLRMQWRPPIDIQKISKQVIAKFTQQKVTNKQNFQNQTSFKNSNVHIKKLSGNNLASTVGRVLNHNSSAAKLEIRLSDANQQQKNVQLLPFQTEVSLLDHSTLEMPLRQFSIFAPTSKIIKETPKQLKSSVFQMNFINDNVILNDDLQQMLSVNASNTTATNEFLLKILKNKDGKNNFNNDGFQMHKNQILRNNNLIAYSQKQRHFNATSTAQSIAAQKFEFGTSNIDHENNFNLSVPLDEKVTLMNAISQGGCYTTKSRDFLASKIKKVQSHKLNQQTQKGGRTRFNNTNFQQPQTISPLGLIQITQQTQKHSTQTSRQQFESTAKSPGIVEAFPDLNRITAQRSPVQMVIPAKIYKKNFQAYKSSNSLNQISDRIKCQAIPENKVIGEKSIEDDVSKNSRSSLEDIPLTDSFTIQGPQVFSKSASPSKFMKNTKTALMNQQRINNQSEAISSNERIAVHPILKNFSAMGHQNSTNRDQQSQSVLKGRAEPPQTGQLYSKLEVIEQKSKDFKEYLKIQLQEVHENHMKEKYPYQRAIVNYNQQQHLSSDSIMSKVKESNDLQPSRYQIHANPHQSQGNKVGMQDFIEHSTKNDLNGSSSHPEQQERSDEKITKKVQSQNLINQKTASMLRDLDLQKVSPALTKVPRVKLESLDNQNKIKSVMINTTEMLCSPITPNTVNEAQNRALSSKLKKTNEEQGIANEGVIEAIKLQNIHKKNNGIIHQQRPRKQNIDNQQLPLKSQSLFQTHNSSTSAMSGNVVHQNHNPGVANIVYNLAIDEPGNFQASESLFQNPARINEGISLHSLQGILKKDNQIQQQMSQPQTTQKASAISKNFSQQPKAQNVSNIPEIITGVGIMPSQPKRKQKPDQPLPLESSQLLQKASSPLAEPQQRKLLQIV